jgi:hypothetical protein
VKKQVGVMFAGGVIDSMVVGGRLSVFTRVHTVALAGGAHRRGGKNILQPASHAQGCLRDPALCLAGPAYNSRQLDKGDLVVEIDGKAVTSDNLSQLLVGSDIAGTPVTLGVKKGGKAGAKKSVTLLRMPSEAIADRRRLFELFTAMKARATLPRGRETIEGMIDNAIELWTRMTIADSEREAKVRKRVSDAQEAAQKLFTALKDAAETKKELFFERHDDALGFKESIETLDDGIKQAKVEHARVTLTLKVCKCTCHEPISRLHVS